MDGDGSTIKVILLLAGLHFLFWIGCDGRTEPTQPAAITPGDHTFQIGASGLEREYVVHVPAQYNGDAPFAVVLMFHGGGGTAQNAMEQTGWDDKAEQEGFLAVFPQGSRPFPSLPASFSNNPQTWNDGSGREALGAVRRNADDVAFVTALLDDLTARFNVDEGRIYAAGFSNGASMVFRLGRAMSARITAIACVAGTDWLQEPRAETPLSLLYITGTADPLNPIDGGEISIGQTSFGMKPPVRESIQKWVQMLDCPADSNVLRNTDGVLGLAYSPCRQESEVAFYTIEGMGHFWPDGISFLPEEIVGQPSDKMQATDVIWELFLKHPNR